MSAAALRARTAALHESVDAAFGRYQLATREGYRSFLLAHGRALPAVEAALAGWPGLPLGWPRTPLLREDLAALGEPMPPPLPFTIRSSAEAWGVLYVLEGSRLGGAMLARQVRGRPSAYLGAAFRPGEWQALRGAITDVADRHGPDWLDAAASGAEACFVLYRRAALAG